MQSLKRFAWAAYDHLGGLIAVNLLWSLASLPWLLTGGMLIEAGMNLRGAWSREGRVAALLLALEWVLCAPPAALLFVAATRWARGEEVQSRALIREALRFAGRIQVLGLLLMGATLLLLLNAVFYRHFGGWPGAVLSAVMLWFLGVLWVGALYFLPVLIVQERRVGQTLRQSFLLALDNVRLSLVLLAALLLGLLLGAATGIGLFCGVLAALALLLSICFLQVLGRYTGEEWPAPAPRRLRDLLRPWEL